MHIELGWKSNYFNFNFKVYNGCNSDNYMIYQKTFNFR